MNETTQSISRLLALVAFTALFAGLWANDRPANAMALKTGPIPHGIVVIEPEWIPVSETELTSAMLDKNVSTPQVPNLDVQFGSQSKTITVESAQLLIAREVLQSHLNQLPLGISAGDYRIVDSLGGVGWLHVRTEDASGPSASPTEALDLTGSLGMRTGSPRMLATEVDHASVQFIRVAPAVIGINSEAESKGQ